MATTAIITLPLAYTSTYAVVSTHTTWTFGWSHCVININLNGFETANGSSSGQSGHVNCTWVSIGY